MATKKIVKRTVTEVGPEKSFWLCDGRVFRSMKDLGEALESMDGMVWNYHVTKEKNDFANWVEDVFGDKRLGLALRKAKNAPAAAKKVSAKIAGTKLWSLFCF